jgi:hypothetical protein
VPEAYLSLKSGLSSIFNKISFGYFVKRPCSIDGKKIPSKLKLEFSRAHDLGRVNKMFSPAIKKKVDPAGFVVKRDDLTLKKSLLFGLGSFLSDGQGDIYSMTIGYRLHKVNKPHKNNAGHDYTEIGTTMARMGSYNSAQLVVCALVLKEWWLDHPKSLIVTEIDPTNAPSLHTYKNGMGWQKIQSRKIEDELFKLCNAIIAPEDQGNPTVWFEASNDKTLSRNAAVVLNFMDQGGLVNKKTGDRIAIDFSALDKIGLNRKRLEAIKNGITSKKTLNTPRFTM